MDTDVGWGTGASQHLGVATAGALVPDHDPVLSVLDTFETRGPDDHISVEMITVGEKHEAPPLVKSSGPGRSSWYVSRRFP
jgi:hypothetical protein